MPNGTINQALPSSGQFYQPEMYYGNYTPDYQNYDNYTAPSQPARYNYGNDPYYGQFTDPYYGNQNYGHFSSYQEDNSNFLQI